MKYISSTQEKIAIENMYKAADMAINSTCRRSKCGAVIIKDDKILGKGYNSPPGDLENQRRCKVSKENYHHRVKDKTCCVHAEQRAIFDAFKNYKDDIIGASLYFIRLDENDQISYSGNPYCTICSKIALDVGLSEFILWHENGICVYNTDEYNQFSFQY